MLGRCFSAAGFGALVGCLRGCLVAALFLRSYAARARAGSSGSDHWSIHSSSTSHVLLRAFRPVSIPR